MRPTTRQRQLLSVLAAVLVVVVWWWTQHGGPETDPASGPGASPSSGETPAATAPDASGLPVVSVDQLPPEAADTLELIDAGGPFPYPDRDGSTFHNREGLLPQQETGWYREYTVPTPGEDDRGARRIVTGSAEDYYWTADHYSSFAVIDR
jgi:ribonuclease T1